jgi:hypothetical protein
MTDKDYNKNKSNHKQNRIGPITITNKGKLPRGKTKNNRNLKFELVAEDGKQSYWATLHEKPNCNEVARTLASMPHKLTGTFLVDCFQSDWYKANPNLVIDVMAILMQDGYIDQDDCDIVFSKTYPFSEAEWVEDTEWKADAIKAFYVMTGKKVSSYPKNKEERTAEQAEDWFRNHVPAKLEVLKWKGDLVRNNGKPISIQFELERAAVKPDSSGRTKYHIGNRNKGDQPARTQFMRFPAFKHKPIRHIRGRRSELRANFLWLSMSKRVWNALSKYKKQKAVEEKNRAPTLGDSNPDFMATFYAMHNDSEE